eukprot:8651182-Pyramimonas_sp.AAC.1
MKLPRRSVPAQPTGPPSIAAPEVLSGGGKRRRVDLVDADMTLARPGGAGARAAGWGRGFAGGRPPRAAG